MELYMRWFAEEAKRCIMVYYPQAQVGDNGLMCFIIDTQTPVACVALIYPWRFSLSLMLAVAPV